MWRFNNGYVTCEKQILTCYIDSQKVNMLRIGNLPKNQINDIVTEWYNKTVQILDQDGCVITNTGIILNNVTSIVLEEGSVMYCTRKNKGCWFHDEL